MSLHDRIVLTEAVTDSFVKPGTDKTHKIPGTTHSSRQTPGLFGVWRKEKGFRFARNVGHMQQQEDGTFRVWVSKGGFTTEGPKAKNKKAAHKWIAKNYKPSSEKAPKAPKGYGTASHGYRSFWS